MSNRKRMIVCRFRRYKHKQNILRKASNLKGINLYKRGLFQEYCFELRKRYLWGKKQVYEKKNKFAYINYRTLIAIEGRKVTDGGELYFFLYFVF